MASGNAVTLRLGVTGQDNIESSLRRISEVAKREFDNINGSHTNIGSRMASFDAANKALDSMTARMAKFNAINAQAAADLQNTMGAQMARIDAMNNAANMMTARMANFDAMNRRTTERVSKTAGQAGLARHEFINLSRQAQDIGVSLFSGQSPFTVLIQQGTQVADVLGSRPGGLGGGIAALGVSLRGLISPAIAAGGAVAAAAAVATGAILRWQAAQAALTVSLNGLGRASGVTLGGANAIAEAAAARSGLSINTAQGLAAQFLGAGVPGRALGGGVGLTRDFSRKLGLAQEEAGKTLAEALADPAKGAQALSEKYGLLSRAQRVQIQQLAGMGDQAGASAKLVGALRDSLDKLRDPTWSLTRAYDEMLRRMSDRYTAIGRGITESPAVVNRQLFGGPTSAKDVFGRMRSAAEGERQALEDKATEKLAGLLNIAQDAELAARAISAQTYAEREAIVVERARIEALRDSTRAAQASVEAEAERTRMIAEAQTKTNDYLRSTKRQIEDFGKTSYERRQAQIDREAEDLLRQVPRATRSAAPPAEFDASGYRHVRSGLADAIDRSGYEPARGSRGMGLFGGLFVPGAASSAAPAPAGVSADMAGSIEARRRLLKEQDTKDAQRTILKQANDELNAQNSLLDRQAASLGKSAAETARAAKEQELLNTYMREHIPLTDEVRAKIKETADGYGEYAENLERVNRAQAELVQKLDDVRNIAGGALGSFVNDLSRGEGASKALRGALQEVLRTVEQIAVRKITEGLFGEGGKAEGGGLLGGALASIFKGNAGNFLPGLFNGPYGLPSFAAGGIMTSAGPLPLHRYATGGIANSPQLALFGEGRVPEAYVPVPSGRIPVEMRGGQQAAPRVTVINQAGVAVAPRLTRGEVQIMIAENNEQLPGMFDDFSRRKA